jgi:integrase
MRAAAGPIVEPAALDVASDYLGLSPEQRYNAVSQHFPPWLLQEPVEFPPHHRTFGWSCLVHECAAALAPTSTVLLCSSHLKAYNRVKDATGLDDYVRDAEPLVASMGWALSMKARCLICGDNRESQIDGYCGAHASSWQRARRRGTDESTWRATQHPLAPWPSACSVDRCVRGGEFKAGTDDDTKHRLCRGHKQLWRIWRSSAEPTQSSLDHWLTLPATIDSVTSADTRGRLHLKKLPVGLQREIRYALHRHSTTPGRSHWRPANLQRVVDSLQEARITTLADPAVSDIVELHPGRQGQVDRRIILSLPVAARSLAVTEDMAKSAGWFDPVIVGAAPFPGTQHDPNRRKIWNLTDVSQRWLRDLLWDYMRDHALLPQGKRIAGPTMSGRINGLVLLSNILRQNRTDEGNDPTLLDASDARAIKETWDMWFREQIPIPSMSAQPDRVLTDTIRHTATSGIRVVLVHSRKKRRTPPEMDSFILSLPEYPSRANQPRPRPLSYADFQLLVDPDNIAALETADRDDVGLADVWLTQAFQGGRISETLKLRLGCIGLVGNAQPYIWRDISKVNVVDYGVPCYLPIYERILRRQEKTRRKLRTRYARQLARLDDGERAKLEAKWERAMPLFPRTSLNPDLQLEVSATVFTRTWTGWFESLGLKGITTHQTRATLATSLLNNGAPAALVRQLLGHFSTEALAHYATYNNDSMTRYLNQVWAAGPGMDKPGTILLRPAEVKSVDASAAAARIDLTVIPIEHGLCRYGPVVGGAQCPFGKNCSSGPNGPCEHFVLTGSDLAYWERKRDAAYHFAEGAPNDEAREYILGQWEPWEMVLAGLREALDELGLLEAAEKLDLRTPVHDYFDPLFSAGWPVAQLSSADTDPPGDLKEAK